MMRNGDGILEEYFNFIGHFNSPLHIAGLILISMSLCSTLLGLFVKYKYRDYRWQSKERAKLEQLRCASGRFSIRKETKDSKRHQQSSFVQNSDYDRYDVKSESRHKAKKDNTMNIRRRKEEKMNKTKDDYYSKSLEGLSDGSHQDYLKSEKPLEDTYEEKVDEGDEYEKSIESRIEQEVKRRLKELEARKQIEANGSICSSHKCKCWLKSIYKYGSRGKRLTDLDEASRNSSYLRKSVSKDLDSLCMRTESESETEDWKDDNSQYDLCKLNPDENTANINQKKRHSWSSHAHISSS